MMYSFAISGAYLLTHHPLDRLLVVQQNLAIWHWMFTQGSAFTMLSLLLLALAALLQANVAVGCMTDLNCSLNGVCTSGACVCDKPWGDTGCGVLQYKATTPSTGKDLYPFNNSGAAVQPSTSLNTWGGPIVGPVNGVYHFFNPLYRKGSLLGTSAIMHGTATSIAGPYEWFSTAHPKLASGKLIGGSNPASVTYVDKAGHTRYTLWVGGKVYSTDAVDGIFSEVGSSPCGSNPAPIYHNGAWYCTFQSTKTVFTTDDLGAEWTKFADIDVHLSQGVQEDPFMYVDKRGNWHIINHAYDTHQWKDCGSSILSAHTFSPDGVNWHMLKPDVEPYHHTVQFDDGTAHTFTTLERPNIHFNSQGQMTHINLAADMITQDGGCANYTKTTPICPGVPHGMTQCGCTNCKYADHAGSIIIALDYE